MTNKLAEMLIWLNEKTTFEVTIIKQENNNFLTEIYLGRLQVELVTTSTGKWTAYCNKQIDLKFDDPEELVLALYNYYNNVYLIKEKKKNKYIKL